MSTGLSIFSRLLNSAVGVLLIAVAITNAQQTIGPTNSDAEKFALQLTSSPAAKRTELLAAHPERITIGLRRELLQHGNLRFATTQYAQALEIYQLVEMIAAQMNDKEGLAATWLNMGSVYYFQGEYERAIDHYRKSEAVSVALGNRLEVGRGRFGIALTLQSQRKPTEALKTYQEALKEFEAIESPEIATTLASIGGLQYELGDYEAARKTFLRIAEWSPGGESLSRVAEALYMQHNYSEALTYYLRALDYLRPQNSFAGMIAAYSGAANCYYYQRNYDKALEFYHSSLAIERRVNDPTGIATRLQSIGNVHRLRGDYASALESYMKSLSIAQQSPTSGTVAGTLGSIGLVRALQGDNVAAIEYFDKSLAKFETDGDQVGRARMLSLIGNARYVQGEYALALEAYEKSRELYEKRSDQLNRAHLLLGIGAVHLAQRNQTLALQSFHEALTFYTTLGRKADMADALSRLAAAYREQGDNAKALEFAQTAAKAAKDAGVFAIASYALTEAGKAQRGLGRKTEALNTFAEAIQVQRSIRPETGPEGIETERSGVPPYLAAMETLIELNRAGEALVRADEAKSQFLREVIQRGNFTITKGMTGAEREEELRLVGDVAALKVRMYGSQDASYKQINANDPLKTRLSAARDAYEAFRKRLYATRPQLALNRGELSTLNLDELRPFVNNNTALLQYAVAEEQVFLFVVIASDVRAYTLNTPRNEIAQKIKDFRGSIDSPFAARELYDILLKPAESQLAQRSKLIIVPDGALWDVPFEALQTSDERYVIDQASVSYAISFAALREMRKRRAPNTIRRAPVLAAFGSPALGNDVLERMQRTYTGLKLAETEIGEVDQLRATYGPARTRTYTTTRATKERVKAESSAATVLHLATPAILDHAVPMYSLFLMSPDAGDDGLLKLWEITSLNSKARVVVLPHTWTTGLSQTGDALVALSWAWFVAGSPSVILNRWEGNAELVDDLHQRLKTSEPNAEQLRQAMLKLRRRENPSHWATYMFLAN
ncbi:MAG TPA: tetratricopeptide repeat protein [Pyrinomonadaceae bacterium]|nr:tetratricopeptide repeat protein [Pyrinomonadaceae bacterium]